MKMILLLLFLSEFWLGILILKNEKQLKNISEELMPIAWHPKKWLNFCISKDERKKTEPIFTN